MNSISDTYRSIAAPAKGVYKELGSKFLAFAYPVETEEEAKNILASVRKEYFDARHHCFAWRLGLTGEPYRLSDDGEPSGTAGMPVLDVIVKNEIYDVCVVVTRYFGGVLLGTGGLVRAYSQGSKIALEAGGVVLMQSCLLCEVSCSYNRYGKVSSLVMENGATVDDTIYESDVKIKFHIPPEQLPQLNKKLADATSGEVQAVSDGESYFMTPLDS